MTSTSTAITTIDKTGWARIENRASAPLQHRGQDAHQGADGFRAKIISATIA